MDHACAGAGLGEDFAREFVDRDLATVTGIEDTRDAGSFGGKGERTDDVLHIDEIARLLAIAVDRDVLTLDGFFDEDRHSGGVGTFRILTRAKDIEEANRRRLEPSFATEHVEVVFAIELGDRVGALWLGQHRLDLWHGRVVAVDRGRRGKDQLAHLGSRCFFKHIEQTMDIDVDALGWLRHRLWHADQCGHVENQIHSFDCFAHQLAIGDRAFDESAIKPIEVLAISGAQAVEHADFRGLALVVFDDVRTDETGAAGDENFHGCGC